MVKPCRHSTLPCARKKVSGRTRTPCHAVSCDASGKLESRRKTLIRRRGEDMYDGAVSVERAELELPAGAPQVRITAGIGSANQKTWNLRRPVTVIGSARPAHIILHDNDVSKAHCVIVNTGREVLLKDLYTSSGTFCNKERMELVALQDGDVVTVGTTRIQVAINVTEAENDDSGCGMEFVEPTKFPKPLVVKLDQTEVNWKLEDAVALIGRHANATIRLDHVEASTRHALLFRFGNDTAVFDLGSRSGIAVNGAACNSALIRAGDRLTIGPCTLAIGMIELPAVNLTVDQETSDSRSTQNDPQRCGSAPGQTTRDSVTSGSSAPHDRPDGALHVPPMPIRPPSVALGQGRAAVPDGGVCDVGSALTQIETELAGLQKNISESWDRLNRWQEQLRQDAQRLSCRDADLDARGREQENKDAALRGQLHDLTRYHEQITAREQELASELARIQSEHDQLTTAQADLVRREGELARRNDELQRREHVLAQRWARLLAATCPHCGKPVRPATDKDAG